MSVVALERLIERWVASEPASLTIHTAIDFVTGSPTPDFARLADQNGEVFALIERRSGESYAAFRGIARAAAEARGAGKLVFGGLHPHLVDNAAPERPLSPARGLLRNAIHPPDGPLHSGEIEAAIVAQTHRFTAWKCGRRFGKSSTMVALAMDSAMCGQSVGYFAPAYKLSAPTFKALKHALAPIIASVNASSGLIEVEGGGSVEIWTLDNPWAGRSRKYHLVEIDEAAFGNNDLAEVYQSAIAPTLLDYKGRAIVASTPHGIEPDNFFYQVCTKEEFGFLAGLYHAPSHKNPFLPRDELERLKQVHHPLIYQQEFEAEFVDLSGVGLFMVERMLQPNRTPWDTPPFVDYVFAVVDSGVKGGVEHDASAVVFFGVKGWGERRTLYILDWEAVELGAANLERWFVGVVTKLHSYMKTLRITHAMGPVFVEPAGLGELLIAKFPGDATPIDTALMHRGKDLRALGCEPLVNGGLVRLTRDAYERVSVLKGQRLNHLTAQLGSFRVGDKAASKRQDDLLDGVTYGCALGFEERAYERLRAAAH
jgi:hypothetical protein